MAKSDELVKYITQQLVTYIDTPRDVRKQKREQRRSIRQKTPWTYRWFGVLPLFFKLWLRQRKQRRYSRHTRVG